VLHEEFTASVLVSLMILFFLGAARRGIVGTSIRWPSWSAWSGLFLGGTR